MLPHQNYTGGVDAQADGVQGYAAGAGNSGVLGRNNTLDGVGVYGIAPNGTGVHGESGSGTAVGGRSASGYAIFGSTTTGIAIGGNASGTATSNAGVFGFSPNGAGVVGNTNGSGTGVIGYTATGLGIFGYASSTGHAGYFAGKVVVGGDFTVTGSKNAAVPHPDGTHRRVYCQESPEPWFEDFGQGAFANGRATVRLDPEFAAVVRNDNYFVFLTEVDGFNALYVTARTPTGFDVRSDKSPTASGSFQFRVVARRKDIAGPRLERVTLPNVAELTTLVPGPPGSGGPRENEPPAVRAHRSPPRHRRHGLPPPHPPLLQRLRRLQRPRRLRHPPLPPPRLQARR